jgi:RNA polymerase primary sigma factor
MRFETNEGLQRYIHEINKYPQLSTEEEFRLGRKIQASIGAAIKKVSINRDGSEKVTMVKPDPTDMESVHALVNANLKFVIKMANKFIGQNVAVEDLISSGNIGMIEAAKRYNPDASPVRFITYASRWLQKYLNNELDENSKIVRIPKNQSYDLYKRRKAGEEVNTRTVEIDKPITSDSENTIGDIMLKRDAEAHESIEQDSNNYIVTMLMKNLNAEETQVVQLRYGFGGEETMTNKEISETLNLPIQVVGRAMKSARFKMREAKEKLALI